VKAAEVLRQGILTINSAAPVWRLALLILANSAIRVISLSTCMKGGVWLLWFVVAMRCIAATYVTNFIPNAYFWDSNGSPYILLRDIYIPYGEELSIGPGVEVLLSAVDESHSGQDTNRIEITVGGRLFVNGTPEQRVSFRALSNSVAAVWFGIEANTCCAGNNLRMKHATISHAIYGVHFSFSHGQRTYLDGVELATNTFGIKCEDGAVKIARSRIHRNEVGLQFRGNGGWTGNCMIHDNTQDGFILIKKPGTDSSTDIYNLLANNTIYRNGGAGVRLSGAFRQYDTLNLWNLILVSNAVGIVREMIGAELLDLRFCDVFSNSTNYVGISPGLGCISVDPRLDNNGFIHPQSPCIDAGYGLFDDPSLDFTLTSDFLNHPRTVDDPHSQNTGSGYENGRTTDIGAYEYQPPLEILSLKLGQTSFAITFPTTPDRKYQIEQTLDFTGWTPIGSNVPGNGAILSITNTLSPLTPQTFFQISATNSP
jgi:hypothetical protein